MVHMADSIRPLSILKDPPPCTLTRGRWSITWVERANDPPGHSGKGPGKDASPAFRQPWSSPFLCLHPCPIAHLPAGAICPAALVTDSCLRDVPVARDSGPAAASAAPPFSTREQGRLDGAEKSLQRGTLAVTSVVLRTRKLIPAPRHRPTPQSPGTRKTDCCAQGYLPVPAQSRLKPASGSLLRSYLHTCMLVTCSHHTCPHSQE